MSLFFSCYIRRWDSAFKNHTVEPTTSTYMSNTPTIQRACAICVGVHVCVHVCVSFVCACECACMCVCDVCVICVCM